MLAVEMESCGRRVKLLQINRLRLRKISLGGVFGNGYTTPHSCFLPFRMVRRKASCRNEFFFVRAAMFYTASKSFALNCGAMFLVLVLSPSNSLRAQTALLPTEMTPARATQPPPQYPADEQYVNADAFYMGDNGGEILEGEPGEVIYDDENGASIFDNPDEEMWGTEYDQSWDWQLLPDGLIYKSYLAGVKEPRLGAVFQHEKHRGWLLDATLGGRVGIVRYGTDNSVAPEGWQLDVEAAAFPRLDIDPNWDMVSTDFRAGAPLTYGKDKWRAKFGYYHLSSHLGDEEIIRLGSAATRINFARDSLILGLSYYVNPSTRFYSEAAWAFYSDGGSDPWEFQFGLDYSPAGRTGARGTPFFALNGHLRQELNYSGNFVAQTGWQWRGRTSHLLRLGFQYYNGASNQYQFYNVFEEQFGAGLWYDF